MSRSEWRYAYKQKYGHVHHNHLVWKAFRGYLNGCSNVDNFFWEVQAPTIPGFLGYIDMLNSELAHSEPQCNNVCVSNGSGFDWVKPIEEEGINPMRTYGIATAPAYTATTSATTLNIMPSAAASVSAQTDTQQQREYLMGRFKTIEDYYSDKSAKIRNKARQLFNLDADNAPKNLNDLIERLAKKDYTIDEKKLLLQEKFGGEYDPETDEYIPGEQNYFYALTWNGPKPDRAGYEAQMDAWQAAKTAAKDAIMIDDPKSGLDALKALEAWEPTGPAN